ncbi:hypothetical protein TRIATDRAFT_300945 [Trichoderma atroviride IMI 206040]|uniref:Uncharacterized protein n=1 Tax=Hypocrea atroviridis (strain ATCC 20476 / IMI 206040) TaxID=452589 RepID=G9P3I6_HYPAI|nr:uncharacterized protein TRIATDRAFT_300945 [Trichoderma atroviride IMI 206040]EHK42944.1 hypothetical protein TRIATDRAFT_300945 [Trichoderma atroviride IMI 206040]
MLDANPNGAEMKRGRVLYVLIFFLIFFCAVPYQLYCLTSSLGQSKSGTGAMNALHNTQHPSCHSGRRPEELFSKETMATP